MRECWAGRPAKFVYSSTIAMSECHSMNKNLVVASVFSAFFAVAGCDRQPNAEIPAAQQSADSFVVSGDYELHYNALRTDQLMAEVARTYGIERSRNKVMLNVSVLHKPTGSAATASDAEIKVNAHNLNGQVKDLQVRRISEGPAIYYIGDVSISGAETLVFQISATPANSTTPLEASFTREFFAD